jgi:hypothetical protein
MSSLFQTEARLAKIPFVFVQNRRVGREASAYRDHSPRRRTAMDSRTAAAVMMIAGKTEAALV